MSVEMFMSLPQLRRFCFATGAFAGRATLIAACIFCAPDLRPQSAGPGNVSLLTKTRLKTADWWPTKGDRSRSDYVGAAECVKCHASRAGAMQSTAMSRAAARAGDAESLRQHDHLSFDIGPYRYRIDNSAGKNIYTISKSSASLSANLLWAFGVGRIGQTYVYEKDNHFYESHLTFYSATQALDVTPGHPATQPPSLEEGLGRRISSNEAGSCFGCHTTASTTNNQFDPGKMFLGVTCEACHGPGANHVAAARSGMDDPVVSAMILNPARLTPFESIEFCGACHRTWQDVISDSPRKIGTLNVRFAPYRLENSRCAKKPDSRITCVACHDPHQPLSLDPASYDSRCLQCHLVAGSDAKGENKAGDNKYKNQEGRAPACPVSIRMCVTCHMPKFKNPVLHTSFTDHWIRIAPPGAPLPN